MLNIDTSKCTGCKMCADVCPADAINFVEDRGGFWYPEVDEEKCIKCGLCEKKCPSLNAYQSKNREPEVYAAWLKDTKQRLNCTSGGVCFALSNYIIERGGYVAGVEYTEDFKSARYVLVNDQEGLQRITQTKYFQADTNGVFKKVKALLEKNKVVLFVGTPCYNAALDSFLGKEYENLIQCDFVCRGNPSPLVHRKHIEYQEEQNGSKVVVAHSKNKKKGWSCFGTYFKFANGKEFYKDRYHNPMTIMFIGKNMNSRDACFSCNYRKIPRVSDITVGDFWGIEGVAKEDMFNGISLLMINSDKGRAIFENVKDSLCVCEKSLEDVERGNPVLYRNPIKSELTDTFLEDLHTLPFGKVLNKYVNKADLPPSKYRVWGGKTKKFLKNIHKINWFQFVHYNFFCKAVHRKKNKYIIPYRGSCIEIDSGASIDINGNLFLNTLRMRGSKAECYLKVDKDAKLIIKERARIAYNSTIQVNRGAILEIGQLGTNANCNIVCSNTIIIGRDVMFGRDVVIYDSNYHKTGQNNKQKKVERPVRIGNHVWIGTRAMIMKGCRIGDGAIISANSWVTGRVKERTMVSGMPAKLLMENVDWKE